MARATKTVELARWTRGINNVALSTELRRDELRDILNFDVTDKGKLKQRQGYEQVYSGSGIHSLFRSRRRLLFVEDTTLKELNSDYTATTIRTGLSENAPVSYAEINRQVYYSNGYETGVVEANGSSSPLGIPTPDVPVVAASGTGSIVAGSYLVGLEHTASDGERSGLTDPVSVTVSGTQGILITIAASSYDTHVYIGGTGGEAQQYVDTIAAGGTTLTLLAPWEGLEEAETAGLRSMPAGDILRYYRGCLWSAKNGTLAVSEPLRYGLYNPGTSVFLFPEDITVLEPVHDGIYIVAGTTYFLRGSSPDEGQPEEVHTVGGLLGTGMRVPGTMVPRFKGTMPCAYWFSDRGAVFGLPGGELALPQEGQAEPGEYEIGGSYTREEDGFRQIGTALRRPGPTAKLVIGDSLEAEVRMNGVTIE